MRRRLSSGIFSGDREREGREESGVSRRGTYARFFRSYLNIRKKIRLRFPRDKRHFFSEDTGLRIGKRGGGEESGVSRRGTYARFFWGYLNNCRKIRPMFPSGKGISSQGLGGPGQGVVEKKVA